MLKNKQILYFSALIITIAAILFYSIRDLASWYNGFINIPLGAILLLFDLGALFIFLDEHPDWMAKLSKWFSSSTFYRTSLIALLLYSIIVLFLRFGSFIDNKIIFNPFTIVGLFILGFVAVGSYIFNLKTNKIRPILLAYTGLILLAISLNIPSFIKIFPFHASIIKLVYLALTLITVGILYLTLRRLPSFWSSEDTNYLKSLFFNKLPAATIGLVTILILFTLLCLPRLNDALSGDEFHQFNAAVGLLKTGTLWEWNFINQEPFNEYSRSWPTTYLHAGSMSLLGINEVAARLPSLIAGLLLIVTLYLFALHVTQSKKIALASAFMMASNPWFIWYATYVRMYIFFALTTLLFFFSLSKIFDSDKIWKRFVFVFAAGVLGVLSAIIHKSFFALLPAVAIYLVVRGMCLIPQDKRATLISKLLLVAISLTMLLAPLLLSWQKKLLAPFEGYLETTDSFLNPVSLFSFFTFPAFLALVLIIFGGVVLFYQKKKSEIRHRIFLIYFFFLAIHITYAFLSNEPHPRYITAVLPINIILLSTGLFYYFHLWKMHRGVGLMLLIITIGLFNIVMWYSPTIYQYHEGNENSYTARNIFHTHPEDEEWVHFPEALAAIQGVYTSDMLVLGASIPTQSYYFQQVFPPSWRYIHIPKEPGHYQFLNIEGKERFLNLAEVRELIQNNKSGLFIWMSRKESSLTDDPEGAKIVQYVESRFQKISGTGVDNSNLQVYIW